MAGGVRSMVERARCFTIVLYVTLESMLAVEEAVIIMNKYTGQPTMLSCFTSVEFTKEDCCNLAYGPQGNLRCWDPVFTYAACCLPQPQQVQKALELMTSQKASASSVTLTGYEYVGLGSCSKGLFDQSVAGDVGLKKCAATCLAKPRCRYFSFSTSTTLCLFYMAHANTCEPRTAGIAEYLTYRRVFEPIRTAQLVPGYSWLGTGHCGFEPYGGGLPADAVSLETCAKRCLSEPHCKFFSMLPNISCWRYTAEIGTCASREEEDNHVTYQRRFSLLTASRQAARVVCWWGDDALEKKCCDTAYALDGVSDCFKGDFTFDMCCSCTIEPHTVLALVLSIMFIVVSGITLKYLPPAANPSELTHMKLTPVTSRMALLDNLKCFGILLVVYDHLMDSRSRKAWAPRATGGRKSLFIVFHVRVFCLVSGITAQGRPAEKVLHTTVFRTVAPLMFWCTVLKPAMELMKDSNVNIHNWTTFARDLSFGQDVRGTDSWYMFSLVCWRLWGLLLSPLRPCSRLCAALAFSAVAGYIMLGVIPVNLNDRRCNLWFLNLAALNFPIYVFGQLLPLDRLLSASPQSPVQRVAVGITLLAIVFSAQRSQTGVDFMMQIPDGEEVTTSFCSNLEATLFWVRGLFRNLLELSKTLILMLLCCPRSKSILSAAGKYSLYPYLLHRPLLDGFLLFLNAVPTHLLMLRELLSCVAPVAIVFLLTTWPIRVIFGVFLEPAWLEKSI